MTSGQEARSGATPSSRRSRLGGKRGVLVAVLVVLVVGCGVWFVPRHGVGVEAAVRSEQVRGVLGESVKVGPTGFTVTGADGWDAFGELSSGDQLGVVGYEYRSGTQRRVLAPFLHPARNSLAWDDPQKWTPPRDAAWGLPGEADLVGTMCDAGTCGRWLVWWPTGDAVFVLDYRPLDAVGAAEGVAAVQHLVKALQSAMAS